MNVLSPMSEDRISQASLNVISSPGSADGATPSDSPDGRRTGQSGQAPALVSPGVLAESKQEPPTIGIYGPSSADSSKNISLQQYLENKLQDLVVKYGSPECDLISKLEDIGSEPLIFQVRASQRLISDPVTFVSDSPISGLFPSTHSGIHRGEAGAGSWNVELERLRSDVMAHTNSYHKHWWSGPLQVGRNAIEGTVERRGRQYRAQWRIKPELPIVAHGVSARVGKLCAAGNAIVPQVAAEFIQAYLDCRPD